MPKYTGVRAVGGGIQIRFEHKGEKFASYLNLPATETNLQNASRLRKSLIQKVRLGEPIDDSHLENPTFTECSSNF